MIKTKSVPVPAIVCAMDEETEPFLSRATSIQNLTSPLKNTSLHLVNISGNQLLVAKSGIGLVCAASFTTWLTTTTDVSKIISAGTAGGLSAEINVGDVAIADSCSYGFADGTQFGYQPGQVPGQPARFVTDAELVQATQTAKNHVTGRLLVGQILSDDVFVTAQNVAQTRQTFPDAIATDMESCAINQVCYNLEIPFISVRGISDLCGPKAGQDFHIGVDQAAEQSAIVCLHMLGVDKRLGQ